MLKHTIFVLVLILSTKTFSQNRQIDSLKTVIAQTTDAEEKAMTYMRLASAISDGDVEAFKKYTDTALFIAKQAKLTSVELRAIINQGIYFKDKSEYQQSLALYKEVFDRSKALADEHELYLVASVNMANLYIRIDEYEKAIEIATQSLERIDADSERFKTIKASLLNALGNSYSRLEQLDDALFNYHQVYEICQEINARGGEMTALNNMALIYRKQENYEKAVEFCERILQTIQPGEFLRTEAIALLNVSVSYIALGNTQKAIAYLNRSKAIAIANGFKKTLIDCHLYLAEAYSMENEYEKSYEAQKEYDRLKEEELKEQSSTSKAVLKTGF